MFRTILVPLDGSRRAEAALALAARLARHSGAILVLVRVVSFLSEYWPTINTTYPSLTEAAIEADLAEASAYLEDVASSEELRGLSIKTTAQYGQIVPTILSVATSYTSDLIVMCSHGSAGMIHWMVGSVAEKTARHSPIPVLIVREGRMHAGNSPADLAQPLCMLVPLDGSISAQAALEPGAILLSALAAPGQNVALHLARVCRPSPTDGYRRGNDLQDEEALAQAKESLRATVEQIQAGSLAPFISERHLPLTWSVARDLDIARGLVDIAEQGEEAEGAGSSGSCQLIAMATHARSGFQRWMLGSITERVLRATRCPVLIVRPSEQRKEQELASSKMSHLADSLARS